MKAFRALAWLAGVAALVAAAWLVAGDAWAQRWETKEERAWRATFGPYEALLHAYPPTQENESARRLEALGKPLGLDLAPRDLESPTMSASLSRPEDAARRAASEYLAGGAARPDGALSPPPAQVADLLRTHREDLKAIEEILATSPAPIWGFDASGLHARRPLPDLYGLTQLERVLMARALEEAGAGEAAAVQRTLDGAWKLNAGLREIPNMPCQIVGLATASRLVGVLRKIDVDAAVWRPRLTEHDYKRSMLDTELLFHWPNARRYRELDELEWRSEAIPKRWWTRLWRPYRSVVWSQVTEGMRKDFVKIRDSVFVREPPEHPPEPKTAADILLSISQPNTFDSFLRAGRFLLDAELTDKILQARQLRQKNGGQWPAAIPGIEATRYPGARWMYSVSPAGVMTLELNQKPYKDRGGFKLPLRFTSS